MRQARFALCAILLVVFGTATLPSCTAILGVDTDYKDNTCNDSKQKHDPIPCNKGVCFALIPACDQNGLPANCPAPAPKDEQCNNSLDENCDGVVDDGCTCDAKTMKEEACYRGSVDTRNAGLCHDGTQQCKDGVWGECSGDQLPVPEICDGVDNDCDGKVDNSPDCTCAPGATQPCYTGPVGTLNHDKAPCKQGHQTCGTDGHWGDCVGAVKPSPEVCEGAVDENCNGVTDEGCACMPGDMRSCYDGPKMPLNTEGVGVCHGGTQSCVNGTWSDCVGEVVPSPEQCNKLDDDCNGKVDDADFGVGMPCSVPNQIGPCQQGVRACDPIMGSYCNQTTFPSPEQCDGIDNDCNGKIDDNPTGVGDPCTAPGALGACKSGKNQCQGGQILCVPSTPQAEDCSGQDKDCDGKPNNCLCCCIDSAHDGNETDVDCGGSCMTPCADNLGCVQDKDCLSHICNANTKKCQPPTCNDAVKNGTETDIDCGGPICPKKCDINQTCSTPSDCKYNVCVANVCLGATCGDMTKNGTETDIDCGGPLCSKCAAGQTCLVGTDCQSLICGNGFCTASSCQDTVLNGKETDIDCGGPVCNRCDIGKKCTVGTDCKSSVCGGGLCLAPTCADGQLNGQETDIDCGGPCPNKCLIGQKCNIAGDCKTNVCNNGFCAQKPIGALCAAANECTSGNCIDGVCCDTACAGLCLACTNTKKGSGPDGVCGNIGQGADPDNECTDQGATSCGTNGFCNGAGACQFYPSGTVCNPSSCTNATTLLNASTCNGLGACVAPSMPQDCSPATCINGACNTMCMNNDLLCASTAYCNGLVCVAKKADGVACSLPKECLSNNCVDGVCCNLPCSGSCDACTSAKKGGGPDGICGHIASGTDPDNECATQAASTCGTTGVCDGFGKCQLYASNQVCNNPTCAADGVTLNKTDNCDGNGACIDSGTLSCAPFACNGGACLPSCTLDSQCALTAYCSTPNCLFKKGQGALCMADKECQTGHCADGVCCDTACNGLCQACTSAIKGTGMDGTCGPILANTDPQNECPDQGVLSCGTNGLCDGNNGCAKYPNGAVCVAASCAADMVTLIKASTCNGAGTCVGNGSQSCSPFACNGSQCGTICMSDANCAPTSYCNGSVCAPRQINGAPCAAAHECQSNNCVDGVCCGTACSGVCQACDLGGSVGTCSNIPVGGADQSPVCGGPSDPTHSCNGSATCTKANGQSCALNTDCSSGFCVDSVCCSTACNGNCQACSSATKGGGQDGVCGNAAPGMDPHNNCPALAASTCGTTGTCDGNGACSKYAAGTICNSASCAGTTLNKDDTCDGNGTCVDGGTLSCGLYQCKNTSCPGPGSCLQDSDCAGTAYCLMTNCVLKGSVGTACSGNNACSNNTCVDGYCCSTPCSGTCQACNLVGSLGTCTNIPSGNTDNNPACNGGSVCNGSGVCLKSNGQTCSMNSECLNGSCADGYCCNGACAGNCQACNLAGSLGACTNIPTGGTDNNPACNGTKACNGSGTCLKANGQTCSMNSECASNACADGVCCNSACSGACQACNQAGSVGTCTNLPADTSDNNPVCGGASDATHACNGSGACALSDGQVCSMNTQCGSGFCTDGVCCSTICNGTCQACNQGAFTGTCKPLQLGTPDNNPACNGTMTCNGSGSCINQKATGQACTVAGECLSGFCADGYCCDTACNGTCTSCGLAGSFGTCSNIPLNTSDTNPVCSGMNTCNGMGACLLASNQGCSMNSQCASNVCQANGKCQ